MFRLIISKLDPVIRTFCLIHITEKMDPFDFYAHFKPMRRMMKLTGTWPKPNASLKYKIGGKLTLFIMTLFTVSTAMDIYSDFGNVTNVMYAMSVILAAFHCMVKHAVLAINKDKFFKLLKILRHPIFTSHGQLNIYLVRKMSTCNKGRLVFVFSGVTTVALAIISPIFAISNRNLPVPFPLDVKQHSFLVYVSIWAFQAVATSIVAIVIPSYDGLNIFMIGIAAAELKILREKILHSTDRLRINSEDNGVLVNTKLRECIIHHVAIERYIRLLQDIFMYSFLIQVLVSLSITVFVGVNLIIAPLASIDSGRSFFFFMATITELSLICVPGNEIIIQSQKIRDACYMSEWTDCGSSVRKTLSIIMERSKRPLSLSAAKFMKLSHESLLLVLKTSYSYFTVLRKMYSESNAT